MLNLSFGTDGVQATCSTRWPTRPSRPGTRASSSSSPPATTASAPAKVNNPAYDPYVIAVGGADANGTATTADDVVAAFSNGGDGTRNPDLVAPGEYVVSLRSPGSYLDTTYPAARIGERLFRGSGTSQAAAVVSGAAALLIQQRPELTPDQVKALLDGDGPAMPGADGAAAGCGPASTWPRPWTPPPRERGADLRALHRSGFARRRPWVGASSTVNGRGRHR